MSKYRKHLTALMAAGGILSLVAGAAWAERVEFGNTVLTVGGSFKPKKLPTNRLAPIALTVRGSIGTKDGSPPPVLDRVQVDFDKNGTMNTRGLPICKRGKLLFQKTKQALNRCRAALVGRGSSSAIVDFPDQEPFTAKGPLLAFNGGPKKMLFHVYANVPAPTAFVVTAKISNAPGRAWGKRVKVKIPTIAGGHGTLKKFNVRVHRMFTFKGKRQSYLVAKCPTGVLKARGIFNFKNGDRVTGQVARTCLRGK